MKKLLFFFLLFFLYNENMFSQVAFGIQPIFRNSTDYVGSTYAMGICVDYREDNMAMHTNFSISTPRKFAARATLTAFDSSTVPFKINVPIEQTVTDFTLHFGFGANINPKKKPATLWPHLG